MAPFESLVTVFYSLAIVTIAAFLAVSTQYTNVTDTQPTSQTDGRCTTPKAAFVHSVARQKLASISARPKTTPVMDNYCFVTGP